MTDSRVLFIHRVLWTMGWAGLGCAGTVLSTNWGEVKEKKYEEERQAPKGMEWRTWEGERTKGQIDSDAS